MSKGREAKYFDKSCFLLKFSIPIKPTLKLAVVPQKSIPAEKYMYDYTDNVKYEWTLWRGRRLLLFFFSTEM